jgi:excisionase family DNA binding protein
MRVRDSSCGQQRTIKGAGGRNVPSAIDASHIDPRAFGLVKVAYGVGETLELLSIGRTSLYAAVKRGELTPVKFGKKSLFYATDLAAFLTKLKGAASDAASAAENVSGTGSDHHSSGA